MTLLHSAAMLGAGGLLFVFGVFLHPDGRRGPRFAVATVVTIVGVVVAFAGLILTGDLIGR